MITLKRSSSSISSFISRYENDIRNNKTINNDYKRDYLSKNKLFFSSNELGNITEILNKKELTMSENKYFDEIKNIKIDKNENKNVIKVNVKNVKENSPRGGNKLLNTNSKSNSKSKINLNKTTNNKSKLLNTKLHKKIENNNIRNIKYNIPFTQKKFFVNEKFIFFIRKIKKIFLSKIFITLKKKYKYKNERFKKSNLKSSYDKNKSKLLNLSNKKLSRPKNKEKEMKNNIKYSNNNNYNILKQSHKNKKPEDILGNIGLPRPPSQLSIKDFENNIINQSHIQYKQKSVKMKLNQNTNNSKIKNNKSNNKKPLNETNLNPKDVKNIQINNISQQKIKDKKCFSYKKDTKKNNNIQIKENNLFINNEDKELISLISKNNNNSNNIKPKEDIFYYNTEMNSNIINTIHNMNNSGRICKIYKNCLNEGNKNYHPKIGGNTPKNKKENLLYNSSPIANKNNNTPFLKKNVSPKNSTSIKNHDKINLNINIRNFNEQNDNNIIFKRCETTSINPINNNLYNLFKKNLEIKKIFNYWKDYSIKTKILYRLLKKTKILNIIRQSNSSIIKRIIKILNICILNKYFNKYKDIYYKGKLLQNLKYTKNKVIKCINIPILHKKSFDIINNININNYINYSDFNNNKIFKKRSQSPVILSKLVMFSKEGNSINNDNNNNLNDMNYIGNIFDEQNKNISNIRYYENMRNYDNDDFISFAKTDRLQDNNNFISENKEFQKNLNKKIINLSGLNIKIKNNKNYKQQNRINNNIFDSDSNNQPKEKIIINKKNSIIDKVNQLRMVFNLLEQHENRNNNLYNCFHKWLYETKINQKNIKNNGLFWSFAGNNKLNINNMNIEEDNTKKECNKYSVYTYKGKDLNYNYSGKKNFADMGKYTPVRGIKNFRSKTSQKISNNQKLYDYNDIDMIDINKNLNLNVFNNESSSLTSSNYTNKFDTNMVYHKKKLITPNIQQNNYNNCFLEYNNNINNIINNNSYNISNYQNYKSMNLTNSNLYKNNNNLYNDNVNLRNYELNNSINSLIPDNYCTNQYKSSKNVIQEKKIDLKKLNRIEEKEINFALYKRNNSYNISNKINNDYNNINNNGDNIKIIYRKVQNGFINNINNKKYCIYSNNIKKYDLKNELKQNMKRINNSFVNLSVNYGKIFNLENDIKNHNEKEKNKFNSSFSFFENKNAI